MSVQQLELEAELLATAAEEEELLCFETTRNASAPVCGETRGNTEQLCKRLVNILLGYCRTGVLSLVMINLKPKTLHLVHYIHLLQNGLIH